MTGTFEDRENAYESKWAHDEEMQFKVTARRNRLLGHWAAAEMGLPGAHADDYAKEIVQAGLTGVGKDPIFDRIRTDLAAAKIMHSDHAIHRKMEELFRVAGDQILHEKKV